MGVLEKGHDLHELEVPLSRIDSKLAYTTNLVTGPNLSKFFVSSASSAATASSQKKENPSRCLPFCLPPHLPPPGRKRDGKVRGRQRGLFFRKLDLGNFTIVMGELFQIKAFFLPSQIMAKRAHNVRRTLTT